MNFCSYGFVLGYYSSESLEMQIQTLDLNLNFVTSQFYILGKLFNFSTTQFSHLWILNVLIFYNILQLNKLILNTHILNQFCSFFPHLTQYLQTAFTEEKEIINFLVCIMLHSYNLLQKCFSWWNPLGQLLITGTKITLGTLYGKSRMCSVSFHLMD